MEILIINHSTTWTKHFLAIGVTLLLSFSLSTTASTGLTSPVFNTNDIFWFDLQAEIAGYDLKNSSDLRRYYHTVFLVSSFQGLVVYDEIVPTTSNAAATIAGITNLLVLRYNALASYYYTNLTKADAPSTMGAKKKELVGNYKKTGKEWEKRGTTLEVEAYDFIDPNKGKVTLMEPMTLR